MLKISDAVEYLKRRLRYCSRATEVNKEVVVMSIAAMEFQEEYQKIWDKNCELSKKYYDNKLCEEKEHIRNQLIQEIENGTIKIESGNEKLFSLLN